MRRLLITLLLASPLLGQAPNGWAPIENGWAEIQVTAPTGTVTTTGTLASGQVALGSGATSITGDAGCTWTGTGSSFVLTVGGGIGVNNGGFGASGWASFWGAANGGLTLGSGNLVGWDSATSHAGYNRTGIDLALSRASAGLLLVEDGSGNARDVQARTTLVGVGSSAAPGMAFSSDPANGWYTPEASPSVGKMHWGYHGGDGVKFSFNDGLYDFNGSLRPIGGANTRDIGASGIEWRTGYFGTSVYSPLFSGGPAATGTNVAGTTTTVAGQLGTGSGASGDQVFTVGTPQASGATQHVAATALTLHNAGSAGTAAPQVIAGGVVRLAGYTVATLPAGTVGDTAYVTDATAPTYLGALTGGGAVTVPVYYDGAAWRSH